MEATRYLVITAAGYGAGPETSRGIRDLARQGAITGATLLVNSPFVREAIHAWEQEEPATELGWQPCLTMDRPIASVRRVPSLVGPDGCFWPLPLFITRACLGMICEHEVAVELQAQHERFLELVGVPPPFVCSHQHVALWAPVGRALRSVLRDREPLPYVRRVREPPALLFQVSGGRIQRFIHTALGRNQALGLDEFGFPGNDWLTAITDLSCIRDPHGFVWRLGRVPGRVVELVSHPGYHDPTLVGRDGGGEEWLRQRVREQEFLARLACLEAWRCAGFTLASPSQSIPGSKRNRRAVRQAA